MGHVNLPQFSSLSRLVSLSVKGAAWLSVWNMLWPEEKGLSSPQWKAEYCGEGLAAWTPGLPMSGLSWATYMTAVHVVVVVEARWQV